MTMKMKIKQKQQVHTEFFNIHFIGAHFTRKHISLINIDYFRVQLKERTLFNL